MLTTLLPTGATASGGTGPVSVSDGAQLRTALADNEDIILTDNIVLTEAWEPIGAYNGTLDGAGYTISGLNVNFAVASYTAGYGLIQRLTGTIKDLTIIGTVTGAAQSDYHAGRGGGQLAPGGTATRAQAACILQRFAQQ